MTKHESAIKNQNCGHRWCHVERSLHPAAERCIYCRCSNENYDGGMSHVFESETWGSPRCKCLRFFDDAIHYGHASSSPPIENSGGHNAKHFGFHGDTIAADVMDLAWEIELERQEWSERGIDDY